jgi:DNA-binding transcriptional regulator YbjK
VEIDPNSVAERLARIEQLIEKYRAAKQRRLLQRAMRTWRNTEARQQFVERETPPHRVH